MADLGEVRYTDKQMAIIKKMIELAENFTDQLYHIIKNHALDDVHGCQLEISIDPTAMFSTREIQFGKHDSDAGFIELDKGKDDERYAPCGENSPEYEILFATPEVAERMRNLLDTKGIVSGSMWFSSDSSNDPPVDGRGYPVRFDDVP